MIVAVLDTGCDINHESVKNNIVDCYNAIDKRSGDIKDYNGHGTHIASIITRMAPECELMIIKVLSYTGRGDPRHITEGVGYALKNGANIINTSFASPSDEGHLLIKLCESYGISIVASAPYYGETLLYPACFPEVISVGTLGADFNSDPRFIDIYAPGIDIVGAAANTNGYRRMTGTSQSAAYVSGMLAKLENDREALYKKLTQK